MKTLLIAPVLALAACVSPGDGLIPIDVDGPVARTIERVLQRTEAYMVSDVLPGSSIPAESKAQVEASILVVRTMTLQSSVDGAMLAVTMSGLMLLHDQMVWEDLQLGNLDQLEAEIYWEDTIRLRSLFNAVSIHTPEIIVPALVPLYASAN